MRERKIFLYQGQSTADAANVAFHVACGRRKARHLRLFLLGNARALVGEANRIALIENRDHDFLELGMDEIPANLANRSIGNAAAGLLGLGVDSGGKILDKLRRGGRSYFSHAWRASEVVIASDSCARDSARVILVDSRCGLGCVLCCV